MWTAEQLEIQAVAHEFAAGEIRPHTSRWDQEKDLGDEIFGKLGEMGFLGMRVPERYGGLEFEFSTYLLALEQLAWGDASVALSVAIHNGSVTTLLLEHGSDEQKEAFLPALASGSTLGALALSEPGSEGHAHRLTTTASRSGETWRLDGTKRWVTNGDRAGLVVVLAATENSSESSAGAFLVPRESPGYSVVGREATMGLRGSQTVSVEFDGVEIERDQVLGDPTKASSTHSGLCASDGWGLPRRPWASPRAPSSTRRPTHWSGTSSDRPSRISGLSRTSWPAWPAESRAPECSRTRLPPAWRGLPLQRG